MSCMLKLNILKMKNYIFFHFSTFSISILEYLLRRFNYSGGSRISLMGAQTPRQHQPIILAIFPEKLHKIEKKLTWAPLNYHFLLSDIINSKACIFNKLVLICSFPILPLKFYEYFGGFF